MTFERPRGFELAAAADFYRGFTPGSGMAASSKAPDGRNALVLSFRTDGTYDAVVARLREHGDTLVVDIAGPRDVDEGTLRAQIGRMLGLEGDADAWHELGRQNGLVRTLQNEFPGFFTATKSSPWDAATWAVIASRKSVRQAARLKLDISRTLGERISIDGGVHHVFPAPATVANLERIPGLSEETLARLRGVAEAALAGGLDAERLRAMGESAALARLQELRGIGPWAASHIFFRGAAPADALPTAEPRVLHGLALLLGEKTPSVARFREIADSWRPFRMWTCVLLSRHLARSGGWQNPAFTRERQSLGRRLA